MSTGASAMPNDPQDPSDLDPNRTLSTDGQSAAAAGQIGSYQLLQMLGEGGMGEVWLGEQKTPIHRTVALKLIKPGMDTKAVVARFESERQALALMDHPNIAQVYDAGATPEGRPYFVMEHVPGLPITEYCDKHRLTMKERLELFMQVCDGVQHAHQKAIIHRDLKPSNVLVTELDGKAVPKIIDFGLVKAMGQRLTDKTMFTELGVLVGTPEYMSPEQADQREQNIDTRTDVYSLGVILYELLVGALPFDAKTLRDAGLAEILRVIREEEPPKPSTKIRSMGDACTATAAKRREEPRSFARHLQGELDWITLKALEKDRLRRYGTASELSADLSRYLHDEPVVAGPATAAYQIRKYAIRHRFGLVAAGAVLVLLAGFVVVKAYELHRIRLERDRANGERDRANRERDRANRITDFMTNMFKVSDPSEAKGNSITAREILDKSSAEIDTKLAKDPELRAKMMYVMGDVYNRLGIYQRAQTLHQHALQIQQQILGPANRDTIESMISYAGDLYQEGRYAEAEDLERKTLDLERRTLGPENPDTLKSMSNLAITLGEEGRYAEAEKLDREALDGRSRVLGPEHRDTLASMSNLADLLNYEGHFAEAEKLDRQSVDTSSRVLGPEDPDTLMSIYNLANVLLQEGRFADAEKLYRQTLVLEGRVLGPEHHETLRAMSSLAADLNAEGRYAEAEKLFRQTLDIQSRVLSPEHPDTVISMNNLANVLLQEGRYAEAENLYRKALDIQRRVLGPEHRNTLQFVCNLGSVLYAEGRYAEAKKKYQEAFDNQCRLLGQDSPDAIHSLGGLVSTLMALHEYAEAEALWKQLRDAQRRVLGPQSPDAAISTYDLACDVIHLGRRDEALSFLREAVDSGLPPSVDLGIDKDTDLTTLHGDPRFAALVAHAKERAAATQKPN
jgi:eukaryotic-like serine/threonine-protein kinase